MNVLVNYVIQDAKEQSYQSEIVEIESPPYICSSDPPVNAVMKWVDEKQNTLPEGQKIVIISIYIV